MSIDNPQLETSSEPVSPGDLLAEERFRQGISVTAVAEALRIADSFVEALERNDIEQLPEPAFIRGYLRNYARLLGISAEDVIARFDRYIGEDGAEAPHLKASVGEPIKSRSHFSPTSFGLTLAGVILVGGLSYFSWNFYQSDTASVVPVVVEQSVQPESLKEVVTQPDPVITGGVLNQDFVPVAEADAEEPAVSPETVSPKTVSLVDELAEPAQTEAIAQEETQPTPLADESETVTTTPVESATDSISQVTELAEPEGGEVRMAVSFREDCWIEIRDANGEIMVSDLKRAGSELMLNVQAPARIRLGNAPGVATMTFDGVPVEISTNKRVASLLLEPAKQG